MGGDAARQIANAHVAFNVVGVLAALAVLGRPRGGSRAGARPAVPDRPVPDRAAENAAGAVPARDRAPARA
jgi:hypothetical protein